MTNHTFNKGDKVRCIYGKSLTVLCQIGTAVWVYELSVPVHSTKVFAA